MKINLIFLHLQDYHTTSLLSMNLPALLITKIGEMEYPKLSVLLSDHDIYPDDFNAIIYTFMSTAQFNHWNRKFHCHGIDLCDTRKREILSKIKSRVLDEFIPIKTIIEEEYRKANLSIEEKRIMPLPSQIGELIDHFSFS